MTSSAKKKKDKKKDFQKTQLKVGKTKPKPSNYTSTSFKAKSIVVQSQSLSVDAPNAIAQFVRHVSMLKNHSESQRADSLAFLTTAVSQTANPSSLPESPATLLPKLQPLIIDTSSKVRQQLLRLLQCFPNADVRAQADSFLLYMHAAMTSLHANIRESSMDVLDWLLEVAGQAVVSCSGGWIKTLSCFEGLLGWHDVGSAAKGWSSQQRPSARPGTDSKNSRRQMMVLSHFLRTGLGSREDESSARTFDSTFPLVSVYQHLPPTRTDAYAYLNLFGAPRDDDSRMMEDQEDRQRFFADKYRTTFVAGVNTAIKEGGELGRSAGQLKKAIEEGMAGYEHEAAPG